MSSLPSRPKNQGAALVVVLSFLVIVVVLTLAISATAMLERRSSSIAGTVMQTDMLVRTVENLVQSQIRAATTLSTTNSWSSQPGMIRNYDISGNLSAAYKLYSAANQLLPSAADLQTELTRESSLAASLAFTNSPALYEDLNRPLIFAPPGRTNITYPIADPRALGMVDGFFWNASASVTGTNTNPLTSSFTLNGTATNLPVIPMPVQWIYVLKDGTLVAPDPTASGTARKVTLPGASKDNPVVGRIAYWTDDESCKLNVNTAAGGVYWDTPRAGVAGWVTQDYNPNNPPPFGECFYAANQPANKEYQRYPGHPASTSLRPVFANYLASGSYNPSSYASFANTDITKPGYSATNDNNLRQALVQMSPRYRELDDSGNPVGSQGGTATSQGGLTPLDVKTSRFYTSIDELNLNTNRTTNTAVPSSSNTSFTLPSSILEQTRFFTTASSRAPEVNLFNLPRVSIWPILSGTGAYYRGALDQLFLFCTSFTTNSPLLLPFTATNNIYSISRSSYASTTDLSLPRNQVLYNYLEKLTSKEFPGFGGNTFADKYGSDMPQILTEIFDFIRSVNVADAITPEKFAVNGAGYNGMVIPSINTTNNTKGYGRVFTIAEAALVFAGCQNNYTATGSGTNATYYAEPTFGVMLTRLNPGTPYLGAGFKLDFAGLDNLWVTPGNGDPDQRLFSTPTFSVTNTDTGVPTMNPGAFASFRFGAPIGDRFPSASSTKPLQETNSLNPSLSWPLMSSTNASPINFRVYQTPGTEITVTITPIPIYATPLTAAAQTFRLFFPAFTNSYPQPLGLAFGTNTSSYGSKINLNPGEWQTNTYNNLYAVGKNVNYSTRTNFVYLTHTNGVDMNGAYLLEQDVAKSLIPMGPTVTGGAYINGDLRLTAGLTNIPATVFLPHTNYLNNTNSTFSHTLRHSRGLYGNRGQTSGAFGRLAPGGPLSIFPPNAANDFRTERGLDPGGVSGNGYAMPNIPAIKYSAPTVSNNMNGVENVNGRPGDWDTGIAQHCDGPWINMADDGDVAAPWHGKHRVAYFGEGGDVFTASQSSTGPGQGSELNNLSVFTPNRQIASPVQFGSLPTGVKRSLPWQTLLFCPNPAALTINVNYNTTASTKAAYHPGFAPPPDYLLLDLFWMPVVEPYAISDPFATAGKVNLNPRLVPFSTIRRESALRGVLAGTRIAAIPSSHERQYKGDQYNTVANNYRYPIDTDKTLDEINSYIDAQSAQGFALRSASQICDIFLIPKQLTGYGNTVNNPFSTVGLTGSNIIGNFWAGPKTIDGTAPSGEAFLAGNALTGDNLRERPYNSIYPRLTTQSNVYQVHYTVQTLKKTPASDPAAWDVDKDVILGEQRGSITMERYIDPRDSEFRTPAYDFATRAATSWPPPTLGRFYKFRTVNTRQFR